MKGGNNPKRFNDPIQDKSRSLGRKNEKNTLIGLPYQNNIRDSSVSNSSNPVTNPSSKGKPGQFGMMNNFMASNLPQQFYNSGSAGAYSYEINLNAVNSTTG
jgi:hypothetical protein